MPSAPDPFFDCQFLWSAEEVSADEPYYIFEDARSDPFARSFFSTCLREHQLITATDSVASLGCGDAPVFIEAPVWARNHQQLVAAGIRGARARVLLYFDGDPTGYWDFAKACGPALPRVLAERRLDASALAELRPYVGTWLGGEVVGPRLLPMPAFVGRDYEQLVAANLPAIARVMSALADDESRATYARILFGRNEDVFAAFVERVFGPQQYMEIVKLKPEDVVVNCGVGRGWEIPYFLCMTQGQGRIFNFDPNIVWSSTPYREFIERFQGRLVEKKIILSDHDGHVDMPVSNASMVRSDEVGRQMAADGVPTERYVASRLDTLSEAGLFERIDYLKMDVEGGERAILNGAMSAIRRFRPKLAIAIYHEAQHFWEYPEMLMGRLDGYRYYIRQYGYSRFETLLYAVPQEDLESRSGAEGLRAASWPDPGAGAARITTFLRDRRARDDYYGGGRRLLTRFSGQGWADADLDPAPLVDTDQVIAAFESDAATLFVVVHSFASGGRQVAVGRSTQRANIDWVSAQGLSDDAVCIPAPGPAGEPGYAIYVPGDGKTAVYRLENGQPVGIAYLSTPSAPVLVIGQDAAGELNLVIAAGGAEGPELQPYRGGGPAAPAQILELPGALIGMMSLQPAGPGRVRTSCFAVAADRPDGPVILATDINGRTLARLDLDARFEAVPTIRLGDLLPGATSPFVQRAAAQ